METLNSIQKDLLRRAAEVRANAYCPYSRFAVGAAVLCLNSATTGECGVFAACNVENASSGLGVCAERNAVAAAVTAGAQPGCITLVAVVGGENGGPPITPCGACRQVLAEFSAPPAADGGMLVLCAPRWSAAAEGSAQEAEEIAQVRSYRLADLIPHWFSRA